MMKRLLTGIALLGFVGCGGEPPSTAPVAATAAPLTNMFPDVPRIMSTPGNSTLSAVLVQVPIATDRTTRMPFTSASYPMNVTTYATISKGSTYGLTSINDDLHVWITAMSPQPPHGGADMKCEISLVRSFTSTGTLNNYFPTQWGTVFSGGQYTGLNWPANGIVGGSTTWCQDYWSDGPVITPSFVAAGFIPQQASVPGASLYEMLLRFDIDFPAYGVTNRWNYVFTKTATSP
jgi:hypothetical protein